MGSKKREGQCQDCGTKTNRHIGTDTICLECEMRNLARHCASKPDVAAGEALMAYLGRPATDQEAEAFTRFYLEAADQVENEGYRAKL